MSKNINLVYRIFTNKEFKEFEKTRIYFGNKIDFQSGFIHLSKRKQVRNTMLKYFEFENDLYIGEFEVSFLSKFLKWELSRDNQYFPHFYENLRYEWLASIYKRKDFEL